MENKKIFDYFDNHNEYPNNIADDPIPYGTLYSYVSSTFLNGFINYVKPIGCYVVNRYTEENTDISDRNVNVCNRGDFGNWHKFKGTKLELINILSSGEKNVYHTNLSCLGADIVVIAKIETELADANRYIFFWFDCDVSDCCIGRFKTEDSGDQILKSVENWLKDTYMDDKKHESEHDEESSGYHKLPLSFINGWVSF